ncbi:MAG: type I 3-dehydroquinate dehydratase [Halobacteriales archaeon]
MHLSDLERPFVCTSLADETVEEAVRTIKTAEYDGARAFEVHLPLLDYPEGEPADRLTSTTPVPLYATIRRGTFYDLLGADAPVEMDDTERVERLVGAVEAGFDGVDVEMDTFDPQPGPEEFTAEAIQAYADDPETEPAEITDDDGAVEQQRAAIESVHEAGGEVIMSAHTYTHLTPAETVAIAERATERGADFVKIVGVDRTMDEALETLEAHLRLNEADVVPYALMAIGDASRLVRPIAPMFGSAWVFAQPELTPGGFHSWPLVENAREVLRRIDWRSAHGDVQPHADRR